MSVATKISSTEKAALRRRQVEALERIALLLAQIYSALDMQNRFRFTVDERPSIRKEPVAKVKP